MGLRFDLPPRGSAAMTTMTHDGYVATIELDEEAGIFHGEVINTRDVLTFQGLSIDELKTAFRHTIGDYVEWCRDRGKERRPLDQSGQS